MIKTIIFDLDGTLLNTLTDLQVSTNYALSQFGLATRSEEEIRSFLGSGARVLVERALPNDKKDMLEEVLPVFKAHYDEHKEDNTAPYAGIAEMLNQVKDAGYKMAIVSNKYDDAVKHIKDEFFPLVDFALGEGNGIKTKPDPSGVFYAIEQLGAKVEESVYVGDSEVDYATAKNSGLPFIAVSWGFREKTFLQEIGSKVIIDSPEQFLDAVKNI